MNKFTVCLWFDSQAEEAAQFYTALFPKSKITATARYGEAAAAASGRPRGSVMTVAFELEGQPFLALNGGSVFQFTPAISLIVNGKTQQEIDRFWEQLGHGGQIMDCGWVTDRFGVTWQIVPAQLGRMTSDPDPRRTERVMKAMLQMKKLDMKVLKQAYQEELP